MEAVVSMAYCHPSVLMYSVGNEIADTGSANGAVMGRAITQRLRALDPTRYTINCINGMVSVIGIIEQLWADSKENVEQGGQDAINGMMNNLADAFASIMQLPVVGDATEEACAQVDIAGYVRVPAPSHLSFFCGLPRAGQRALGVFRYTLGVQLHFTIDHLYLYFIALDFPT